MLVVYRLPATNLRPEPSCLRRIHCFGVGDVQEVRALGLEFGVCGHLKVDTLHLNQAPFLQQQVLHHLEEEEGGERLPGSGDQYEEARQGRVPRSQGLFFGDLEKEPETRVWGQIICDLMSGKKKGASELKTWQEEGQ